MDTEDPDPIVTACRERIISLPAHPSAVRTARHRLRSVLRAWGVSADMDTAILLTSELVTNAIVHGRPPGSAAGSQVCLRVRQTRRELQVEVHDNGTGPTAPALTEHGALAESGRGLELVEMLADEWGVRQDADGRYVYFVLAISSGAAPSAPVCGSQPSGAGRRQSG